MRSLLCLIILSFCPYLYANQASDQIVSTVNDICITQYDIKEYYQYFKKNNAQIASLKHSWQEILAKIIDDYLILNHAKAFKIISDHDLDQEIEQKQLLVQKSLQLFFQHELNISENEVSALQEDYNFLEAAGHTYKFYTVTTPKNNIENMIGQLHDSNIPENTTTWNDKSFKNIPSILKDNKR